MIVTYQYFLHADLCWFCIFIFFPIPIYYVTSDLFLRKLWAYKKNEEEKKRKKRDLFRILYQMNTSKSFRKKNTKALLCLASFTLRTQKKEVNLMNGLYKSVSLGSGDQCVSSNCAWYNIRPSLWAWSGLLPQHWAHQREDSSLLVSVGCWAEKRLPQQRKFDITSYLSLVISVLLR